ncbi:MAG: hypothetical protein P1U40_13845 [Coxiellaceae bacterium]|nr:hypothetical protein [Coxiellaceae bacterium]
MRTIKPNEEHKSLEPVEESFYSLGYVDGLFYSQLVRVYSDGIDILRGDKLNKRVKFNEYFRRLDEKKSIVTDLYLAMLYVPTSYSYSMSNTDFAEEVAHMSVQNWPAIDENKDVNVKSLVRSKMHLDRFNHCLLMRFPTVEDGFFVRRVSALQSVHARLEVNNKRELLLERAASAAASTHYSPRLQAVAATHSDSELLKSDSDSAPSPVLFK